MRFCRSDRIKIGMKAMGNEVLEVRIDNIGYDFPAELRRWISGQAGSDKYALKAALLDEEPAIKPVLNQLNRIHGKIFLMKQAMMAWWFPSDLAHFSTKIPRISNLI